ncbi:hypothetical protein [Leptolyngbya iicbica]|nr:hypothetical protein [Leptolyngbya sp. LK]
MSDCSAAGDRGTGGRSGAAGESLRGWLHPAFHQSLALDEIADG